VAYEYEVWTRVDVQTLGAGAGAGAGAVMATPAAATRLMRAAENFMVEGRVGG
jgi:hypothetical protein